MQVIKREFITKQGSLIRVSYHKFSNSPAITGNDLCNLGISQKDLQTRYTEIHRQGVCYCKACKGVWDNIFRGDV